MRLTGWDRKTVRRYLYELQNFGLITWDRRRRAPNVYWVLDGERCSTPQDTLTLLVHRGGNVLILGPPGSGKTTYLMRLALNGHERPPILIRAGPAKNTLVAFLNQLADHGLVSPADLPRAPNRLSVQELAAIVENVVNHAEGRLLVLIDDIDRAPPSLQPWLARLAANYAVQVVATASDEKRVPWFVDHAWCWEVPSLSEAEVEAWVRDFVRARGIPVVGGEKGLARLCRHVYLRTGGNPRSVQAFLRKIEAQGYVDHRLVREELKVGGRWRFVDMTWLIILTAALIMAIRYISMGMHDRTLYVLAGLGYAMALLMRWFAYRWRKEVRRK
ncbi:MAG: NACHT domain-containing protein [Candidatus Bipolaricaulaceae bacterium]